MQSENQTFNYIFIAVFKQRTNFLMQLEQTWQIKQIFSIVSQQGEGWGAEVEKLVKERKQIKKTRCSHGL